MSIFNTRRISAMVSGSVDVIDTNWDTDALDCLICLAAISQ